MKQDKSINQVALAIVYVAIIVVGNLIVILLNGDVIYFMIPIGLNLLLALLVAWKRRRAGIQVDERVEAITDKSARNGFIATWLAMFIFVDFGAPDAGSLLIVVASGLAVLIVSSFFYYFKSG